MLIQIRTRGRSGGTNLLYVANAEGVVSPSKAPLKFPREKKTLEILRTTKEAQAAVATLLCVENASPAMRIKKITPFFRWPGNEAGCRGHFCWRRPMCSAVEMERERDGSFSTGSWRSAVVLPSTQHRHNRPFEKGWLNKFANSFLLHYGKAEWRILQ